MASSHPIIDSHIHLYPQSELTSLAWCTPDHPLGRQCSVSDFRSASGSQASGFVFLETDRKNDSSRSWAEPLAEVSWLRRIVTDEPREGEGHGPGDGRLCLAVVPWAPVDLGPDKVEEWLARAEEVAGPETWRKVKGFRYLLQDKPDGTALEEAFIGGLKVLGRRGFVFDVGVDQHRRGKVQLSEAVEMVDRAHEGVEESDKVVFVLNHLCKPDLTVVNTTTDPSFIAWRTAMFTLSKCSRTYMKLSGAFAELPAALARRDPDSVFEMLYPWFAVVLAAFGPSRIMFGSDWPVCTVAGGDGAWEKWRAVVARMCYMASLTDEDQAMLWAGTARKAYGIEE